MPDPAIAKVEDALKAVLEPYADLSDYTVHTGHDPSEAFETDELPVINIYTESQQFRLDGEQHQNLNDCLINFEVLEVNPVAGILSRSVLAAVSHIMKALAVDRTLGNRLQDLEERDVAPPNETGRDIAGASLQYFVQFYTPRDDPFTISGHGGLTF